MSASKNVVSDTSTGDFEACRSMITGPWVNEHPPYPGCTGFLGWESVMMLASGELLCAFSAGYWHVSFPNPVDLSPELDTAGWKGFRRNMYAPTGGRALICRSTDLGKTWTQPTTLVDTQGDNRHPVITELPDGSLVCAFFVVDNWYGYKEPPAGRNKNSRCCTIRSEDGGKTWTEPVFMPSPFKYYDRMCSDMVLLPGGSLLFSTYGMDEWGKPTYLGLYRSDDGGRSWRFVSRLAGKIKEIDEPAICQIADGTIVMIARPDGELAYSTDEGETWDGPYDIGIGVTAPNLIAMKDGTVACIFGSNKDGGGIQFIFSDDSGRTWIAPAEDAGFKIDNTVHSYANGCELPDGSIYIVYYDPMGDQTATAIRSIRIKIREDRCGIDILPAYEGLLTAQRKEKDSKTKDVDAM